MDVKPNGDGMEWEPEVSDSLLLYMPLFCKSCLLVITKSLLLNQVLKCVTTIKQNESNTSGLCQSIGLFSEGLRSFW